MPNPLTQAIEAVPGALIAPLADLVRLIVDAPNPSIAIERAKFYALADAEKLAADALLKKALP